jgi:hypothetical protein
LGGYPNLLHEDKKISTEPSLKKLLQSKVKTQHEKLERQWERSATNINQKLNKKRNSLMAFKAKLDVTMLTKCNSEDELEDR